MDDEERIGSRSFKEDPFALNLLSSATSANSDIEVGIHSCITLHADDRGASCKNVQILVIYGFLKSVAPFLRSAANRGWHITLATFGRYVMFFFIEKF